MPNYRYVATSKFEPFTFDEMLKPALLAQAKHDEIEKAYGELGENAEEWGSRIDEINDPTSYARYQQYKNAFDENYQSFSKHGLNHKSNKALMDVKRYYKNRVKPIEDAWTARQKLQEAARTAHANNPSWYTENDIMNASLDRWLENPGYDWGKSYSGAMITQQVAAQVAPIARALQDYGRGKQLDATTYALFNQHGITPAEAQQMYAEYQRDPLHVSPNNFIKQIIDNTVRANVGPDWNPETIDDAMANAYRYGAMGIPSAIGETTTSPVTDYATKAAIDYYYANKLQENKNPYLTGSVGGTTEKDNTIKYEPYEFVTQNPEQKADAVKNRVKFNGYFVPSEKGSFRLSNRGISLLKMYKESKGLGAGDVLEKYGEKGLDDWKEANELHKFITNSLGYKKQNDKNGGGIAIHPGEIGNAYNKFQGDLSKHADSYITQGYKATVNKATGDNILFALFDASGNGKLDCIKVMSEGGKNGEDPKLVFKKNGTLSYQDAVDEKATVKSVIGSEHGCIANIKSSSGEYQVLIPDNISGYSPIIKSNLNAAASYQKILQSGKVPVLDENNIPMKSDFNKLVYQDKIMDEANYNLIDGYLQKSVENALNGLISIGQANSVEDNKVNSVSPYDPTGKQISDYTNWLEYMKNMGYNVGE